MGCSRMDLSHTTGRTYCQSLACLTPDCLMRAGLLVSHSHPTPLFPSPSKKNKHPLLRVVLGPNWGSKTVVRQGRAPTAMVLILQTKHRGSGCNSRLCVRRPFPAWPSPGCLFCLFLEAIALMDGAAGDADSMGFVSGGPALSPLPRGQMGPISPAELQKRQASALLESV